MKRIFSSIYAVVFAVLLPVFLPYAFLQRHADDLNFMDERKTHERQTAFLVLNRMVMDSSRSVAAGEWMKDILEDDTRRQTEFKFTNIALYDFEGLVDEGRSLSFVRGQFQADNILDAPSEHFTVNRGAIADMVIYGARRSLYWIPLPTAANPQRIFLATVRDDRKQIRLDQERLIFWLSAAAFFLLFYAVLCTAVYGLIKRPIRRLEKSLSGRGDPVESLDPEDFGELGEFVDSLKSYMNQARSFITTAENVDPVTGLLSGEAAGAAYLAGHQNPNEIYAVFYRSNFAKEYVKSHGRQFRDRIFKLTGAAVASNLPSGSVLYALQDHFLMALMTEDAFQQGYPRIQQAFNRSVRSLPQNTAGGESQVMTLSAVGVSNKSIGYEVFHDVLQKLHDEWNKMVDREMAGWALMNADDQWVKGSPEEMEGGGEADIVPEEPAALKDPEFARKVFIVKLAFMFQFDPKKAAKLYKVGVTRLTRFLDDDVIDTVKQLGEGAQTEVKDLIERIRLVPKGRLYYTDSDFKLVFITDVRMIRKIPRAAVGHWFAAGFRQLDDLADTDPEDLLKIDPTAERSDVDAVIQHARSLRGNMAGMGAG